MNRKIGCAILIQGKAFKIIIFTYFTDTFYKERKKSLIMKCNDNFKCLTLNRYQFYTK